MEKVYKVSREDITNALNELFDYLTVKAPEKQMVFEALRLYNQRKLDFVDTLLYAYYKVGNHTVITFDEKLGKLLQ